MYRQNHDVYGDRYLIGWALTDQGILRRLAAEERLARQVRQRRAAVPFQEVVARLGQIGAAFWAAMHGEDGASAAAISRDVPVSTHQSY